MRKIVYQYINYYNIRIFVLHVYEFSYIVVTKQLTRLLFYLNSIYEFSYKGGGNMLYNLEKVRKEKNVSLVDMADLLGVRYQTVADKIHGISEFKFGEALKVKNAFFSEYDIEFLFAKDEQKVI